MPLFSVLERNPKSLPHCDNMAIIHLSSTLMEEREAHAYSKETDSATTSVPRKWSEEPSAHLPPGVWPAASPSQTFLFCSPGQNVFLLWPLGYSLKAFVFLALLEWNVFWRSLGGEEEESRKRRRKRKGSGCRKREKMKRKKYKILERGKMEYRKKVDRKGGERIKKKINNG